MLSLPVRESVTRDTTRAGFMSRNFLTKREIANYFLVGSDRTEVMQARPCLSHLSSLVNLHIVQCLLLTLEVNITASGHQANINNLHFRVLEVLVVVVVVVVVVVC